jgi:hypothetical protein
MASLVSRARRADAGAAQPAVATVAVAIRKTSSAIDDYDQGVPLRIGRRGSAQS